MTGHSDRLKSIGETSDNVERLIEAALSYRKDVLRLQGFTSPDERLPRFRKACLGTLRVALEFLEREERMRGPTTIGRR